ncbi:MAG: NFACT RNA binding domain-containing protein, partial [Eubacterium sp.]
KKKIVASKPLHFISSEGFHIYVGKNNYQNDYISTKLGVVEDCWLHVKDIPGSHVLIVADGRFITEETLLEAGMLAAYYSKSKNSENVPVDYVEFKYLKKPKKAKPGMVIFTNQNTMYVTPNKDKINKIEQTILI